MKAQVKIDNPGEIQATLTLSMTLDQLLALRGALKDAPFYGPPQWVREAIDTLTTKARAHFELDDNIEEAA